MKDRYLFRGKGLDSGEWVIGCYVCAELSSDTKGCEHFIIKTARRGRTNEMDLVTLGQCTGLKDKNGMLIFEGDIIRLPYDVLAVVVWTDTYDQLGHIQDIGYVVKFIKNENGKSRYWRNDLLFWVCDEDKDRKICGGVGVEVVGNVFDNPELLKETDA